jgi:hypothetical protein
MQFRCKAVRQIHRYSCTPRVCCILCRAHCLYHSPGTPYIDHMYCPPIQPHIHMYPGTCSIHARNCILRNRQGCSTDPPSSHHHIYTLQGQYRSRACNRLLEHIQCSLVQYTRFHACIGTLQGPHRSHSSHYSLRYTLQ